MKLNTLTFYCPWLLLLAFLLGSCIYSFLNVVIYRVPLHIDIVVRRSRCTNCGHALSLPEMLPIAGWILLGGKCRHCHTRISVRYPFVEALGGIITLLCIHKWSVSWQALFSYIFIAALTVIAFVDMDTMKIPNCFIVVIGITGILASLFFPEISILERLLGSFSVSAILLIFSLIVPGGFGGGDIKLTAVCGFFLGWRQNIAAFIFAILIAGVCCILLLALGRINPRSKLALGPFLCLGMTMVLFMPI